MLIVDCHQPIIQQLRLLFPERFDLSVVVPISGGKDSQCCLELACTLRDMGQLTHIIGLFCDTQFEHPLTYQHIQSLETAYDVPIIQTRASDVPTLVRKYKRFPSGTARFCTSELKMATSAALYRYLALHFQTGFEVWYGVRSSESKAREKRYLGKTMGETYPPHEVFPGHYPKRLHTLGVSFRLPIIDWSDEDVYEQLEDRLNPLYGQGFDRVGCFPCLAAGDGTKVKAFGLDEFGTQQWETVQRLEKEVGRSVFKGKKGEWWGEGKAAQDGTSEQEGNGCSICSM